MYRNRKQKKKLKSIFGSNHYFTIS